jgi:sigma-70-like protein
MFKSYTLAPYHYAAKWDLPKDSEKNDTKEVNELAIKYTSMEDGPDKEALFLQLIRNFHSYLFKYTLMVVKGQIPSLSTPAGKDAAKMLKTLMPSGSSDSHMALTQVCKTLHLAFKQQSTDDVYDIMVMCFLKAIKKYDPFYHLKIKQVSEHLNKYLTKKSQIDVNSITDIVKFNSAGCLKWLSRKGFITPVTDAKKRTSGYSRGEIWPIPKETFSTEPIGFTYFAQTWFRYYLNDYITNAMSELEAKPDILQLEHAYSNDGDGDTSAMSNGKDMVPSLDGDYTDNKGTTWVADITLMNLQFDISSISNEWVYKNKDKLFKDLTVKQRWILKMVYLDELSWSDIAKNLDCTVNTAKAQWKAVLLIIRSKLE